MMSLKFFSVLFMWYTHLLPLYHFFQWRRRGRSRSCEKLWSKHESYHQNLLLFHVVSVVVRIVGIRRQKRKWKRMWGWWCERRKKKTGRFFSYFLFSKDIIINNLSGEREMMNFCSHDGEEDHHGDDDDDDGHERWPDPHFHSPAWSSSHSVSQYPYLDLRILWCWWWRSKTFSCTPRCIENFIERVLGWSWWWSWCWSRWCRYESIFFGAGGCLCKEDAEL